MKTIKGLLLLLPLAASFPALSGEFSGKVIAGHRSHLSTAGI